MATTAESGSAFPALSTLFLAAIFAIFGFYALSGASVIRRLPFLTIALILIGIIYTVRGVAVFQQLFQMSMSSAEVAPREIAFSLVSLVIGLAYLIGTIMSWRRLRASSNTAQT